MGQILYRKRQKIQNLYKLEQKRQIVQIYTESVYRTDRWIQKRQKG